MLDENEDDTDEITIPNPFFRRLESAEETPPEEQRDTIVEVHLPPEAYIT